MFVIRCSVTSMEILLGKRVLSRAITIVFRPDPKSRGIRQICVAMKPYPCGISNCVEFFIAILDLTNAPFVSCVQISADFYQNNMCIVCSGNVKGSHAIFDWKQKMESHAEPNITGDVNHKASNLKLVYARVFLLFLVDWYECQTVRDFRCWHLYHFPNFLIHKCTWRCSHPLETV